MTQRRSVALLAAGIVGILAACQVVPAEETLLEDTFEFFELGETWEEHEAGAPDTTLAVSDSVLQMASSGIEEVTLC